MDQAIGLRALQALSRPLESALVHSTYGYFLERKTQTHKLGHK